MKITAFVPIKLNSERLPGKNILNLGGKALAHYIFNTLKKVPLIDKIYVYCSDPIINKFIPNTGVVYLQRDPKLDGNLTKGIEIYKSFVDMIPSDYYLLAHTTSPFISSTSINKGIEAILYNKFDSAFSVKKIQSFSWYKDNPLNFDPKDILRTQDLTPIYVETSAFYIFTKQHIYQNMRIGRNPFLVELNEIESVDIDNKEDFDLALALIKSKIAK